MIEKFVAAALTGIMANSELQKDFWKEYPVLSKQYGAKEAAQMIERRIAYRALRVATAVHDLIVSDEIFEETENGK